MKKEYKIAVAGTGYVGLSIATFLPHSSYPTLYVLILTILTNPLPERMGLKSRGGGGMKERVKDTGWMGLSGREGNKGNKGRSRVGREPHRRVWEKRRIAR